MTKNVTKKSIQSDDYREWFSRREQHRKINVIRSHCHEIYTEKINKIALSSKADKRVIMANGVHYYGQRSTHSSLRTYKLNKMLIKKMSYNERQNIVIDSVVLPNKPLSNIEIIDAAQKLSLYGFREIFLRDTLPKKKNLTNVVF